MNSATMKIVISLSGTIGLMVLIPHNATARTSTEQLQEVESSVQECLKKASRPGFPYYSRPEADAACGKSKQVLFKFAENANRNKNLSCSSRIPALENDLWLIQFIGSARMQEKTGEDLKNLKKNCYNMDTRH